MRKKHFVEWWNSFLKHFEREESILLDEYSEFEISNIYCDFFPHLYSAWYKHNLLHSLHVSITSYLMAHVIDLYSVT